MNSRSILQKAHEYIKQTLSSQNHPIAIDATVGNGHDTLFLSRAVGSGGHVYGFDIQVEALTRTRHRLQQDGQKNVTLIHDDHQHIHHYLPVPLHGDIQAVMFNLGYLPHGDRNTITLPHSTVTALQAATRCLARSGIISVVLYTGHPGGEDEAQAVIEWATQLSNSSYHVTWEQQLNRIKAPSLLIITKK